jgi:hypothetical protein
MLHCTLYKQWIIDNFFKYLNVLLYTRPILIFVPYKICTMYFVEFQHHSTDCQQTTTLYVLLLRLRPPLYYRADLQLANNLDTNTLLLLLESIFQGSFLIAIFYKCPKKFNASDWQGAEIIVKISIYRLLVSSIAIVKKLLKISNYSLKKYTITYSLDFHFSFMAFFLAFFYSFRKVIINPLSSLFIFLLFAWKERSSTWARICKRLIYNRFRQAGKGIDSWAPWNVYKYGICAVISKQSMGLGTE